MSEEAQGVARRTHVGRTILVELAMMALFVALTVAMTWPLAANLDRAVSDPGDPLLVTWIMDWTWHSMTTPGAEFWHAPIFHPLRYTVAFSENLLGITVFFLPLFAAGVKPLVIYNIAMLGGFAFSGYGAYVLGRLITGSRAAGLVGGIFFAFMPYRFDHLAHLQNVWSGWLPIALAALIYYGRRPSWTRAGLLGLALAINGMSNGHWLLFGGVAIGLGAIFLAMLCGRTFDRRYWLPLLVTLAVTHGILLAALQPYSIASELYGMRRWPAEAASFSAEFSSWLVASRYNRLYGGDMSWSHGERCLFPGAVVVLLASLTMLGLRRGDLSANDPCVAAPVPAVIDERRRRVLLRVLDALAVLAFIAMCIGFADQGGNDATIVTWRRAALPAFTLLLVGLTRLWIAFPGAWNRSGEEGSLASTLRGSRLGSELQLCILWVILGVVGSLGMNAFFHQFLYNQLAPFRSLRVPARWSMIAYVGLAGLAAAGIVALCRRMPEKWRPLAVTAVSLLLLLELRAAPIRWYLVDTKTPAVYEWLARTPVSGATLELPIAFGWSEYVYIFRQTAHHKPILNGISGYPTKLHARIEKAFKDGPVPLTLYDDLEKSGCGLILVHNDTWGSNDHLRAWLRHGTESGRLAFVRRFDHGAGGDWVFALTRVEKNLAALRGPDVPDAVGRTPSENARIFLEENGRTYNSTTFAWLDTPKFDYEMKGELVASGWALSPYGVKEVRLVFGNGTVTLPAERFAWSRIHELMPWYAATDLPGFKAVIPTRPEGLFLDTDLLVEVVDGRGEVTKLDHLFIKWHPRKKIVYTKWNEQRLPALLRTLQIGEDEAKRVRSGDVTPLVEAVIAAHPEEGDGAFIAAAYRTLLGRAPEEEAIGYYATRMGRGATRRDVVEGILGSKEFKTRMVVK